MKNHFVFRRQISAIMLLTLLSGLLGNAQRTAPKYTALEIGEDRTVTFRIQAPEAENVIVWGSWDPTRRIKMQQQDSLWVATIGPLEANAYEYEYMIDGVSALDPNSKMVTRDGAWIMNMLMVPGEGSQVYQALNVPHGTVQTVWYDSPTLETTRRMNIYLPPGYEKNNDSYPVLYLLHGGGGDEECWLSRGRTNFILDNLIASGEAQPMIVVMPNGNPNTSAAPLSRQISEQEQAGIGAMASGRFEKSLVSDIMPFVESNFRVLKGPEHRSISGFSMGGFHTQNITNAHPEMFQYIGVMSMGLFSAFNPQTGGDYNRDAHIKQLEAIKSANPKLYWIGMGNKDFLFQTGVKLRELYDEVGLKYEYLENEGTHDWMSWRMYLATLVPKFFK